MKHKIDWEKLWKTQDRWWNRCENSGKSKSWEEQEAHIQMLVEKELTAKKPERK